MDSIPLQIIACILLFIVVIGGLFLMIISISRIRKELSQRSDVPEETCSEIAQGQTSTPINSDDEYNFGSVTTDSDGDVTFTYKYQ